MALLTLAKKLYDLVLEDKSLKPGSSGLTEKQLLEAIECIRSMQRDYDYDDIKNCLLKVVNECPHYSKYPALRNFLYLSGLTMTVTLQKYTVDGRNASTQLVWPVLVTANKSVELPEISNEVLQDFRMKFLQNSDFDCLTADTFVFLDKNHRHVEASMLNAFVKPKARSLPEGDHLIALPIRVEGIASEGDLAELTSDKLAALAETYFSDIDGIDVIPLNVQTVLGTIIKPWKRRLAMFLSELPTDNEWVFDTTQSDKVVIQIGQNLHPFVAHNEVKEILVYEAMEYCEANELRYNVDFVTEIHDLATSSFPVTMH
ncbi:hypothetical protein [Vibrio agarivorans]|uniref:DUF2863 domain-containing protein n=1 Tax=Vibrio agarivorans TaxID=153622 RepID=A0ABT7Y757_9VIBR|nr:hypothetical protein [Vibrio agarivorans]MDN2483898.1 hypothetical protein [Vibrio agarivorans]